MASDGKKEAISALPHEGGENAELKSREQDEEGGDRTGIPA